MNRDIATEAAIAIGLKKLIDITGGDARHSQHEDDGTTEFGLNCPPRLDEKDLTGIERGLAFEKEVLAELTALNKVGISVDHCGGDNRTGDFVLKNLNDSSLGAIVVEAKYVYEKSRLTRFATSRILSAAMVEREAKGGILVVPEKDGLAPDLGDWAEGRCGDQLWVATTLHHIVASAQFLFAKITLSKLQSARVEGETIELRHSIKALEESLHSFATMRRRITLMKRNIEQLEHTMDNMRVAVSLNIQAIKSKLDKGTT